MRTLGVSILLVGLSVGCGGGDQKATAPVEGTVKFQGSAVKGGSLTFNPVGDGDGKPGRSGTATVGEDGTFTVTTYSSGDGAVLGKHRVSYSPPTSEDTEGDGHAASEPSPFAGLAPKQAEVTVEDGSNTLEIELVKP